MVVHIFKSLFVRIGFQSTLVLNSLDQLPTILIFVAASWQHLVRHLSIKHLVNLFKRRPVSHNSSLLIYWYSDIIVSSNTASHVFYFDYFILINSCANYLKFVLKWDHFDSDKITFWIVSKNDKNESKFKGINWYDDGWGYLLVSTLNWSKSSSNFNL